MPVSSFLHSVHWVFWICKLKCGLFSHGTNAYKHALVLCTDPKSLLNSHTRTQNENSNSYSFRVSGHNSTYLIPALLRKIQDYQDPHSSPTLQVQGQPELTQKRGGGIATSYSFDIQILSIISYRSWCRFLM